MTLDPERDLQRMHSLIIMHILQLEKRISKPVADPCLILNKLREVVYQIEQKHRSYQRWIARDTKYGSK